MPMVARRPDNLCTLVLVIDLRDKLQERSLKLARAATYLFCCLAWNKTLSHAGSLRGFGVIDSIKTQIEAICNQTVSCADILTVATRDSVVALGGPSWTVPLRRDSIDANEAEANSDLPGFNSSRSELEAAFLRKGGLNTVDMVALSGAHTIGQAQCSTFRARIYGGDTNTNAAYAASLRANCPRQSAPRGLLHSDQVLFNNYTTDNTVRNFASNPAAFSSAFTTAMIKMGNIAPKTGTQGQIRLSCSRVNS
uniref:Peroxidase 1 n=1 Tax=Aegilops tauschii TaxID=37682 RepID=M8CVT5_AEGTA